MQRQEFTAVLKTILQEKSHRLQNEITQLRHDLSADTKSTAGDKHETSRAMAQLEMEKLGHQLQEYHKQLHWIQQFETSESQSTDAIGVGSLIRLTNGWYFLGLALGKVTYNETPVFCISLQSPLGTQLLNKQIGDEITLPNLQLKVTEIC